MKKVFLIFLSLIFIFTFQVKAITLEDITSGKFQSKDIAEVYPSADGVHYFTATNGNTRIVKCEYRTGHEVDTLFDVKTARECNLEQFDGFSLSPDEKHLLIYADSEPIYRRSFTKPCSFKLLCSVKHIILPDKRTNNFSILILTVFNKLKQWRKCNLTINAISDFCNLNHLSALIP